MKGPSLSDLVPPLRGCVLCVHSLRHQGELHCACPAMRQVAGMRAVHVVRAAGEMCGPGAQHMDMQAWRPQ
jgi:hypothetical protein